MRNFLRLALVWVALIAVAVPVTGQTKPVAYQLDTSKSVMAFSYAFEGSEVKGTFPHFSAEVALDFVRLENSTIDVELQARTVKGGFIFATQALRGPKMLDAATYPVIKFISTKLTRDGDRAKLICNITIKNVTRPLTLNAQIFRTAGSKAGDQDNLVVRLTGQIDRSAFGVDGFKSYVGDVLKLTITVEINKK